MYAILLPDDSGSSHWWRPIIPSQQCELSTKLYFYVEGFISYMQLEVNRVCLLALYVCVQLTPRISKCPRL